MERVCDTLRILRYLRLVRLQRITVDDRRIHSPEVEKVIDVFGRATSYNGEDVHFTSLIHGPRYFGRKTDRCAFEQAAGETDAPGVDPVSDFRFCPALRARDIGRSSGLGHRWIGKRKKHKLNGSESSKNHHWDFLNYK